MAFELDDLLPQHVREGAASQTKKWSDMQVAIFDSVRTTSEASLVEAVAGSGKTTTLVEAMKHGGMSPIFLAFNKSIAEELKSKVPAKATVKTLNALGHMILTRKRPGAKLEKWKSHNYFREHMSQALFEQLGLAAVRVVSVAKGSAVGIRGIATEDEFYDIAERYCTDIDLSLLPTLAKVAHRGFDELLRDPNSFDFDDQLYVPISEGWSFPRFDCAFVDEAQDLNAIQHLMLRALSTRIIAVGDRRQAIYGFRGALTTSMDILRDDFSMREFPLSITYRCAREITRMAQSIVPQIQWREDAPEGIIHYATEYPQPIAYDPKCMIVCRNNAPIFELALQFLRDNVPCRVLSSFLDEFEKFINGFKCETSAQLRTKLELWITHEREKCSLNGATGRLEGHEDRFATALLFCEQFATVQKIIGAIRSLVTSTAGPRISTVHRAKGLEASTVHQLRYDLIPSPRAISPEQLTQEENLRYVAITRAKDSLIFLPN